MRLPLRRGAKGSADELLDAASLAFESGDLGRGLRLVDDARLAASRDAESDDVVLTAWLMRAAALSEAGRFAEAEKAARAALEVASDDVDAWDELADALFRQGRFEEAATAWEAVVDHDAAAADAWHHLGRVATWLGDHERARRAFRRAHELQPDEFVLPVRVAPGEFDRLANAAWRDIPAAFRARLRNALVVVEELPGEDEVEAGTDPDILGVYEGATALEDDVPERIVLYQRNHEAVCGSLGELEAEIRRTVLHEVGHHFGMEDAELPY
ncbi:MAG TPA: metallopeptidase family protein [Candidatus Dormibacteraeota bacterium]